MKLTLDYDNFETDTFDTQVAICEPIDADIDPVEELDFGIEARTNSLWFANDIEVTPEMEAFINEHFEHPANVIMFIHLVLKGSL